MSSILRVRLPNGSVVEIPAIVGPRGESGKDGKDGADGKDGTPGTPGYTPEKGVDYFTEAEKQEIVTDVINALPEWQGGSY
jgi:hypothetical protein